MVASVLPVIDVTEVERATPPAPVPTWSASGPSCGSPTNAVKRRALQMQQNNMSGGAARSLRAARDRSLLGGRHASLLAAPKVDVQGKASCPKYLELTLDLSASVCSSSSNSTLSPTNKSALLKSPTSALGSALGSMLKDGERWIARPRAVSVASSSTSRVSPLPKVRGPPTAGGFLAAVNEKADEKHEEDASTASSHVSPLQMALKWEADHVLAPCLDGKKKSTNSVVSSSVCSVASSSESIATASSAAFTLKRTLSMSSSSMRCARRVSFALERGAAMPSSPKKNKQLAAPLPAKGTHIRVIQKEPSEKLNMLIRKIQYALYCGNPKTRNIFFTTAMPCPQPPKQVTCGRRLCGPSITMSFNILAHAHHTRVQEGSSRD